MWPKSCVQLLYWPSSKTHWWPLNPSSEKHTHLTNTHCILSVMLIVSNQFFCSSFDHKYTLTQVFTKGWEHTCSFQATSDSSNITQTHLYLCVHTYTHFYQDWSCSSVPHWSCDRHRKSDLCPMPKQESFFTLLLALTESEHNLTNLFKNKSKSIFFSCKNALTFLLYYITEYKNNKSL